VKLPEVIRAGSTWYPVLTAAALLLLLGHVAFALNAFGMILKSTSAASVGRHD
jgi:hypothetical protein